MNWQRFALACVAVYVFYHLFGWLFHGYFMQEDYAALAGTVFRPEEEMNSRMWLMFATSAVWTVLFCYIFTRGREGGGIMEGVRFGLIIGLFMSLPMAYENWMIYPLPLSMAHTWFVSGLVFSIVAGIIVAAIYKPKPAGAL